MTNSWDADATRISYEIAGINNPALRPPSMMTVQPDPDPQRSAKIHEYLMSLLAKEPEKSDITAGNCCHFPSYLKMLIGGGVMQSKEFLFVSSEDIKKLSLSRNGAVVDHMLYYRISPGGETHYLSFYMTPDDKIADWQGE